MKGFWRIFRHIHLPKGKMAVYISFSLLATFFSAASLGMLSPFMQLIINGNNDVPIDSRAVGSLVGYIQHVKETRSSLFALGVVCLLIVGCSLLSNTFRYLSFYISAPVRNEISGKDGGDVILRVIYEGKPNA